MELNAENIINEIQSLIKALKDCGGWVKRGNGEGWFNHEILADALSLINSQEQRIKELTEENDTMYRLVGETLWQKVSIKADTVRKMQERLKMRFGTYVLGYKIPLTEALEFIDQIAKEMVEKK